MQLNKGWLDLRDQKFDRYASYSLIGEWQFYNDAFLLPHQMDTVDQPFFVKIPNSWNNVIWKGKEVGKYGFATYQCHILLPKDIPSLAINLPIMGTAYTLYANQQKIVEVGIVGKEKASTSPR